MGLLTTFAQTADYYSSYYTTGDSTASGAAAATAAAAFLATFMFFMFFIVIIAYVLTAIFLMRIFAKAGVPAWIAWVPFYNTWKLLELGGQQGFWAILAIIPGVNIASQIFIYIAQYHIGKKFGKSGEFVLWAIFLPIVWFIWLAFDQSKWNDGTTAQAVVNPPTPPTPTPPTMTPPSATPPSVM
jgi:hypothetical protein